jgi:hypothetical protein
MVIQDVAWCVLNRRAGLTGRTGQGLRLFDSAELRTSGIRRSQQQHDYSSAGDGHTSIPCIIFSVGFRVMYLTDAWHLCFSLL